MHGCVPFLKALRASVWPRTRLHKLFKSVEDPAFSVLTPRCWQALTPSTAQGTYSRPTQTSLCHLGLLGKQVGRDRGAMGRSCVLNSVEWLNGDSVHPVPERGGGRGHPQAKESENLWCLLPSFWLKTEDSKALEGGGGHQGEESRFQISHGGSPPNVSIGLGKKSAPLC